MAGGRLARTLRRDARRRSIFDHPPPSAHTPLPHLLLEPTAYLTTTLPSSQQLQPAIATSTIGAALGGVLLALSALRGVPTKIAMACGLDECVRGWKDGQVT